MKKHHIDRRADAVIAAISHENPASLFSTAELAKRLGVSEQFLEIGRNRGYGPKFVRVSPRVVRYRLADVTRWLDERAHFSTTEYR